MTESNGNPTRKTLQMAVRPKDEDEEIHYLIKETLNLTNDAQVVYYLYGQMRRFMGDNPLFIDLKLARQALDKNEVLEDELDELRQDYSLLKERLSALEDDIRAIRSLLE